MLRQPVSFYCSEKIFQTLEPYYSKLTVLDLNKIVELSISNNQVWPASDCAQNLIPKLLNLRKKDIDPLLFKKLEYQIVNRK
jgi:hypothetical protein